MNISLRRSTMSLVAATAVLIAGLPQAQACTGIRLVATDGAVIHGRTTEWGAFDLQSRQIVIPRNIEMTGTTPDGKPGVRWTTRYGTVGIDAVNKDVIVDGMNERGLVVGTFYLPGFTQFQKYESKKASQTLGPLELSAFLLTQFATVNEVRVALEKVRVVPLIESSLGFPPPVHYIVTGPDGDSIVVEYLEGELTLFENPLGVITNAPSFDWHLTNLRNYVKLSPVAQPGVKIDDLDFQPLGAGSGMIGLPGDFTPPSRFVRAVAFSKTARPTADASETLYEVFRILDSFNVPLGSAEGSDQSPVDKLKGMRSSTSWTSAQDTRNKVMYYHTQHNRRVRSVNLNDIDFSAARSIYHAPLDTRKEQDIQNVTPQL